MLPIQQSLFKWHQWLYVDAGDGDGGDCGVVVVDDDEDGDDDDDATCVL